MDTLKPELFHKLTGGSLQKVLDGIDKALEVGFSPVKVNAVLMKGVNDGEVDDFINLTREKAVDVRFIEYMPIGCGNESSDLRINNQDLIAERPWLKPATPRYQGQPQKITHLREPGDGLVLSVRSRINFAIPVTAFAL